MTITGAQVREARKLLNWSRLQLGHRAGVSDATIESFEVARRPLRPKNVQASATLSKPPASSSLQSTARPA